MIAISPIEGLADPARLWQAFSQAWIPPPQLRLSEWMDREFVISAKSGAAEPGRWKTLPYQVEPLDCFTDPEVEQVTMQKSARVGWTLMCCGAMAYHVAQDPCPQLMVQPTIDDAKGFSKENIDTMFEDVPALRGRIRGSGPRTKDDTLYQKLYPGGVLSLTGANSARGFRRIGRRVVLFDETDGYPPTAGNEGDQIQLGIRRTEYFHNRKIAAGSTPTIHGLSRIEPMFMAGDQRRYYVPCPHCGRFDFLRFSKGKDDDKGMWLEWPKGKPREAVFICRKCGCEIEHKHKRSMVEDALRAQQQGVEGAGWVPGNPGAVTPNGRKHASFHIWAAYSYSPNASWGQICSEFVDAKGKPEVLKTFVNTVLGETWKDEGEVPDWEKLYSRREDYRIGTIPSAAIKFLTAGCDVQKDYVRYEVVGWGVNKESWSIESGEIHFDTGNEEEWVKMDPFLSRTWDHPNGRPMHLARLAIDSGFNTQAVYNWSRRYPISRVNAIKGVTGARSIVGAASPVDVKINGQRKARGYKIFPVGSDIAKAEFYGWLRLPLPEPGQPYPAGYCHTPEYESDFFMQWTAEQLMTTQVKRTGYTKREWVLLPNRKNHGLDCRIYARAAAALCGLDMQASALPPARPPAAPASTSEASGADGAGESAQPQVLADVPVQVAPKRQGSWLGGRGTGGYGRPGGWLGRGRR